MEIIKTVITTLDILLILLFFTFGKTAKDKTTAIGFGSMITVSYTHLTLPTILRV